MMAKFIMIIRWFALALLTYDVSCTDGNTILSIICFG